MTATIIDGRKLAKKTNEETFRRVKELKEHGINPGIAVVLVGNNQASARYVRNKKLKATSLGIRSITKHLPETTSQDELIDLVQKFNNDPTIHGILVQSPLPSGIDEKIVNDTIDPAKDVDGFNPVNVGRLFLNDEGHYPVSCTPSGIMQMFNEYNIKLTGKRVVIIGRSTIVGRPMAALLINANATVTVLNHYTSSIREFTKMADVIISAVGKERLLTKADVKPGVVLIDVGQNLDQNGKLVGDIDYNDVLETAEAITPVPGGVGPMTIATLMKQTVDLAEWSTEHVK